MTTAAQRDYDNLDKSNLTAVEAGLAKLATEPNKRGQRLSGNLSELKKLVVGKKAIRIIFEYSAIDDAVFVIAIGMRRNDEVYRIAAARLAEDPQG